MINNHRIIKEISYCKVKLNPKESFAGIFSAKESIYKSNNNFSLNDIEILFDKDGRPFHENFYLSISHSKKYVTSITIPKDIEKNTIDSHNIFDKYNKNNDLHEITKSIKNNQKSIRIIKYFIF